MPIKATNTGGKELDAIDKKIFYYLKLNYRMPRKRLAKLVSISPQRLNHRIRRLESNTLEPFVCLNYPKLQIRSYAIFFDSLSEAEITKLEESGNIYYLLHLVGNYKYFAIILAEDIVDLLRVCTPNKAPEVYSLTDYHPDNWNGFNIKPMELTPTKKIAYILDSKDYRILNELCVNPNASTLEISEKLRMARQTISEKMKLMESANIIQGYRFSLNIPQIRLLTYFISLTCQADKITAIRSLVQNNKYGGFIFQSNNKLFFSYVVFDHRELFDFLEVLERASGNNVDVYQNTGSYIVEPVPKSVLKILHTRSAYQE